MISSEKRQTILHLHAQGYSDYKISKLVKAARNTVRKALKEKITPEEKEPEESIPLDLLQTLHKRCDGNAIRIKEILEEEYGQMIGYSTLTRVIREAHLRDPKKRVGCWTFEPGEEMQHDTSPHKVQLGEDKVIAQCAALIFHYSRMVYIQYYPRFRRFEARCFLQEAITALGGACQRCVIDNTSVILAAGCGADAVMAPETQELGKTYGFTFLAHELLNPERKGTVERMFHYAENNLLAGRRFTDWDDLNRQAAAWCRDVANKKQKRALGMSPEAAMIIEWPHLQPLPRFAPPIYLAHTRIVGDHGYIHLDTNRYSVPDRLISKRVTIRQYLTKIVVTFDGEEVASHVLVVNARNKTVTDKAHHPRHGHLCQRNPVCEEEQLLRGKGDTLDSYLSLLKKRVQGRGQAYFRRLLELQRTYPEDAFLTAVSRALHYKMFDLGRLERLILEAVAGDIFRLDKGGDGYD